MNALPQQPFFDNPIANNPQQAYPTPAAAPFPQPAQQPQRPGTNTAETPAQSKKPVVLPSRPHLKPSRPASVREQPMSAHEAARLAESDVTKRTRGKETSEAQDEPAHVEAASAEIAPDANEPSGGAAKDVACVVGGAAIAAVGVPMLVLPGPGVAAIVGGAALAGKGVKSLAQRAGAKGRSASAGVDNLASRPQATPSGAPLPSQAASANAPFAQSASSHVVKPSAPTVDDVKQAAANAGKAALGAASLAARAIAAKAKDSKELENARESAVRTAREMAEKAASSQAAQTAAEITASTARTLANKAEAFARAHRR